MSAHWTVYCGTCDEYGPDIRHSSSVNLWQKMPRFHPDVEQTGEQNDSLAQFQWSGFLNEHEWHDLRLVHE